MAKEQIDDIICEIMHRDGPDGHVDGHDVITNFITALLEGSGDAWAKKYMAKAES